MALDRDEVLAASRAWVWVPPDAMDEVTDEYRCVRYPSRTSVQWSDTDRPAGELVDELLRRMRSDTGWVLRWWVSEATRPADTEDELARRGFVRVETVDVLALELTDLDALPELDVPGGVTIDVVADELSLRTAAAIDAAVFDWPPMTEEQRASELAEISAAMDTGDWRQLRLVALLDGNPVGTAGCTFEGTTVRLWGAAVLPDTRGRGVYRALLAARLRTAVEKGASLALVKGRAMTSAPVLRRAGFVSFGQERCWQLAPRPA